MFSFLFKTNCKKSDYIIRAYLVGICLSMGTGYILSTIYPEITKVVKLNFNLANFIGLVLFAPILETLMMVPIIALIRRFTTQRMAICTISAFTWAGLHGLLIPIQAITIFPLFFIFTLAFLVWDKQGRKSAYLVVMSIHMLNNVTVFWIGALSN